MVIVKAVIPALMLMLFLLLSDSAVRAQTPTMGKEDIRGLAECLQQKKFTMYGSADCSACALQKKYFGDYFSQVPYVNCTDQGTVCFEKKIFAYPTWEDAAGKQYRGAIPLPILKELSGCDTQPVVQIAGNAQVFGVKTEQLLAAFAAGLFSFFAPCLLPLLPAYFSAITGFTFAELYGLGFEHIRKRIILSSLCFIGGFAIVYTILGITGSIIGQVLGNYLPLLLKFSGIYLIILGCIQLGIFKFKGLSFDYAWNIQKRFARLGYISAVVTGIAAGLSWIPCVGPLLSPILLLAAQSNSFLQGGFLLFVYSLGLTAPFLAVGLYFPAFIQKYQFNKTFFHRLALGAGIFMIAFGAVLLFEQYGKILIAYRSYLAAVQQFFENLIQ